MKTCVIDLHRLTPSRLRITSAGVSLFITAAALLTGYPAATAQICPAPASWFPHSSTPPFDPNSFPGSTATDCDFHQWAWQTFLYITQDEGGAPRFLSYPTDNELFPVLPTEKPAPRAMLKAKARPPLQLKVRSAKPKEGGKVEDPGSIFQAGTNGILVAEDGNPLFYSVHFDWTFYEFVESNHYFDYQTYIAASPTTDFPPGALELKASWKIVAPGSFPQGYTTKAMVPTLSNDPAKPGNIIAGPPMRPVTVALVGLHVVGIVANHPEFIWATFEQKSNAPNLPAGVQPSDSTPVSSTGFTFYQANTPANQCNLQPATYTLTAATQTLSPITQVFRQFTDGGGVPDNITAIDTLNASVHSQMLPADVFSNYDLIGGVWLLPGALQPNLSPTGSQLHGSPDLANSTMETFAQAPFPAGGKVFTSCFGCHTTTASQTSGGLPIPAMNMNLSHILTDGLVTREVALRKLKAEKK